MMTKVATVLSNAYSTQSNNCSGFFKAVAKDLGMNVPNVTADQLIDFISQGGPDWVLIGKGPQFGGQAATYAGQGYLVVALLKASEHLPFKYNPKTKLYDIPHPYSHGHMSVVLPATTENGYPYVISGSIVKEGQSDGTRTFAKSGEASMPPTFDTTAAAWPMTN